MRNLLLTNQHLRDLNPLIAGEEACAPGHSFGPFVRKYTLIHYVLKGKGVFHARGGSFPVEAGQAFLILPGETTTYTADEHDPWHYCWIGFDGSLSARFSQLPPVLEPPEAVFRELLSLDDSAPMPEYRLAALLYRLASALPVQSRQTNLHVRRVKDYIRACYMQPIRVESIAGQLNLDRRYLSRLFKKETGQTVQDYLIDVRLEEAERLLRQGCTVEDAARLCGYECRSNFSRMFRQRRGISPTEVKG